MSIPSAQRPQWLFLLFILLTIALHLILLAIGAEGRVFHYFSLSDLPLIVILILGGIPLALRIFLKIVRGDFGADLLAAIALITGILLQEYLAATLILLMLAGGEVLENYALKKASLVLQALANRMPNIAHKKIDKKIQEIPLSEICIGDEIVVFPHETAPVDGDVVEGFGSMDEAYLTGEPFQIAKAPGASVLSGAINGENMLVIRATKLAKDSRYAQIMRVMEEAEQKRPRLRRIGDQLGASFAPFALIVALSAWYFSGDAIRFLAVLVVATPCPLLIAIPITIISAISIAAKHSIIIKDPTILERLPTCRIAIFDKTGTLTYGKPELTQILLAPTFDQNTVLQLVASIERYSKHPLANAIVQRATQEKIVLIEPTLVSEKPGQGLIGKVDRHNIRVTHRKKLSEQNPKIFEMLPPDSEGLECVILIDDAYAATLRFRDTPRAEGKSFVSHLGPSHHFEKVMLVSGDRATEVSYLAKLLGIKETLASQSPEQKVLIVRKETEKAPTLFMGDGINDAPALATATVGIAFGQQNSITSEAAGAVILESTLIKVDELIHISLNMRRILLQSALGGMLLSAMAMGFAAFGFITPVAGALLQEAIDVIAILNALRLTWRKQIDIDLPK